MTQSYSGNQGAFSVAPKSHLYPSRSQFDYIILSDLCKSISRYADKIAGNVLDYGCGAKPYAELFHYAVEYVGADFPNNPYADIHLDQLGQLPPSADEFSAVVSFQVLEHVPEVHKYFSACARVLQKKKGQLLLTTHGIWEYHPGPHDLYRWTHEGLAYTIQLYGFKKDVVEPITTGHRSILQIIATRIERRPGNRKFKAFLFRTINLLADALHEDWDTSRRMYGFPICYLYFGELEG